MNIASIRFRKTPHPNIACSSACVSAAQAIKNKSLFTAAEEARLREMSAKERETELRRTVERETRAQLKQRNR